MHNKRWLSIKLPRYAGVPTTDLRNDFSPIILANPKSHSFTWGYSASELSSTFSGLRSQCTMFLLCKCFKATKICVMRNLVTRSVKRPLSCDKIISSMSPFNFSITTNIRSGVSNILSKFTTPGCDKFWSIATSFLSCASCFVGNRILSITWKEYTKINIKNNTKHKK